jgi:hypothetical protein
MGHGWQGVDRRGCGRTGCRCGQRSRPRQRELFLRYVRLLSAAGSALQLHLLPATRTAGDLLSAHGDRAPAGRGLSRARRSVSGAPGGLLSRPSRLVVTFEEPGDASPSDKKISGGLFICRVGALIFSQADRFIFDSSESFEKHYRRHMGKFI